MEHEYRITVQMVSHIIIYVVAETPEEAKRKTLANSLWQEESDELWFDHTPTIEDCIEVDEDGEPV
jgi:hypothetical protein